MLVGNFFKRFIFDSATSADKERDIERQVGEEIRKWLVQNNGTVNTHIFTLFEKQLALKFNLKRDYEAASSRPEVRSVERASNGNAKSILQLPQITDSNRVAIA
jgi:hypothetical protein